MPACRCPGIWPDELPICAKPPVRAHLRFCSRRWLAGSHALPVGAPEAEQIAAREMTRAPACMPAVQTAIKTAIKTEFPAFPSGHAPAPRLENRDPRRPSRLTRARVAQG